MNHTERANARALDPRHLAKTARTLDDLLAGGRDEELLDAVRKIARDFGGIGVVAEQAGLNRTYLYRVLSPAGNPEMRTIAAVLRALGLRLAIQPLNQTHPAQRQRRPQRVRR